MNPRISAAQRDALYDQILDRLSGIGDFEFAIRLESYETAERIGREYSDDLRLLLDALVVGELDGLPAEFGVESEVLLRTFPRLRAEAERYLHFHREVAAEPAISRGRHLLVIEACDHVLRDLGGS